MEIRGIDNMTYGELYHDIENGGKFVIYTYVISVILMTFKSPSNTIYYVKSGELPIKFGWSYLLITLFLGWWGNSIWTHIFDWFYYYCIYRKRYYGRGFRQYKQKHKNRSLAIRY